MIGAAAATPYNERADLTRGWIMALYRWSLLATALVGLVSTDVQAADETSTATVVPSGPAAPNTNRSPPGSTPPGVTTTAPLVGLDSGAMALVPPGSGTASRNDGLAGSPSTGVDLTYIPAAERDSYINSHDFADHLQTSTRAGHHPSALSQLGGAGEAMAINGALLGIEGLTFGAH